MSKAKELVIHKDIPFSDIKTDLKKSYRDLMDNPEHYGLDKTVSTGIKMLPSFVKKAGYKIAEKIAKQNLDLNNSEDEKEVANFLFDDLEDAVKLVKERGEKVFKKNYAHEGYKLEQDTIDFLKTLQKDQPKEFEEVVDELMKLVNNDDNSEKNNNNIGHKLLSVMDKFLKTIKFDVILKKINEIVVNLLEKYIPVAEELINKVIDNSKMDGTLKTVLKEGINVTKNITESVIDAVKPEKKEEVKTVTDSVITDIKPKEEEKKDKEEEKKDEEVKTIAESIEKLVLPTEEKIEEVKEVVGDIVPEGNA